MKQNSMVDPMRLLWESFLLYKNNLWIFLGYSIWYIFPAALQAYVDSLPQTILTTITSSFLSGVEVVLILWITIIWIKFCVEVIEKKKTDLSELQKFAVRYWWPVFVVMILKSLLILGGLILLIIPGVIFSIRYAFVQYAVVLEDKKTKESFSFSRDLVRGRFFQVLFRLIAGPILIGVIYYFLTSILVLAVGSLTGMSIDAITSKELPLWVQLTTLIVDVTILPILCVYSTLLYLDVKKTLMPVEDSSSVE